LTTNNPTYDRFGDSDKYHYEAIKISVPVTDGYYIGSNSSIDTYGYIYLNSFNPLNTEENLIIGDDDNGDDSQFLIEMEFISTKTYILVVTAYDQNTTGPFVVFAAGSNAVKFTSMNNISTTTVVTTVGSTTKPLSSTGGE
jgi:hypothetical protein